MVGLSFKEFAEYLTPDCDHGQYAEQAATIAWHRMQKVTKSVQGMLGVLILRVDWTQGKDAVERSFNELMGQREWPARQRPLKRGERSMEADALRACR